MLGISQETMLASPVPLGAADIIITRGAAMLDCDLGTATGMIQALSSRSDVEIVPLIFVRCLSGGAMPESTYRQLKNELIGSLLDNGPFDGVCVANHGAMEIASLQTSADSDLLMAIRAAVGPDTPMVMGMDMHGHLTAQALAAVNGWAGYRTAPHRDMLDTGAAAVRRLLRLIDEDLHPQTVAVRIPLLLPGEFAMTTFSPAAELYAGLAGLEGIPGVFGAMLLVGFAWNDRPWTGMTALVSHESDAELARRHALDLAASVWRQRDAFMLKSETGSIAAALNAVASSGGGAFYLSDSGDNVTAGAYGDLTTVLRTAVDRPDVKDIVILGIAAPGAVARAVAAGIGTEVTMTFGDEHLSAPPDPFRVTARVEGIGGEGPLRWARLRMGHVLLTVHASRCAVTCGEHIAALGIDPVGHRAYVVKLGYLHPGLEDIAKRHMLMLTDGTANLDITQIDFRRIVRPAYPLDPFMDWDPESAVFTGAGERAWA